MKNETNSKLLAIIGSILFYFLFWLEKQGINLLIFDLFILGSLFFLFKKSFESKYVKLLTAGTLLAALMIVIHNSAIAKVMHFLSFLTLIGFVHKSELVFAVAGYWEGLKNILVSPFKWVNIIVPPPSEKPKKKSFWRQLRLLPIPIFIVGLFWMVYYNANPKFAEISDKLFNQFEWIFRLDFPVEKMMFFLFGTLFVGGVILKFFRPEPNYQPSSEDLLRSNIKANRMTDFSIISLQNEFQTGMILFGSLNLLLFFVNILDIRYVWFGFNPDDPQNLKQYVHEGTYLLILSIFMAMCVIIYFFRGNLNFFKENKRLKQLAFAWIGLNTILCISVAIRNMRYIDFHGLAYLRIGVMLFLGLTFYGLWTMFLKVKNRKTLAFLLHKNSWAAYLGLILITFINWDVAITRYNLTTETRSEINVPWLLWTSSDKNLFLLYEMEDVLKSKASYPTISKEKIEDNLERRTKRFKSKTERYSWLSWNYSDYRNEQFLKERFSEGGD